MVKSKIIQRLLVTREGRSIHNYFQEVELWAFYYGSYLASSSERSPSS